MCFNVWRIVFTRTKSFYCDAFGTLFSSLLSLSKLSQRVGDTHSTELRPIGPHTHSYIHAHLFFFQVSLECEVNLMGSSNLAIVVSPILVARRPAAGAAPIFDPTDFSRSSAIIAALIDHYPFLFNVQSWLCLCLRAFNYYYYCYYD